MQINGTVVEITKLFQHIISETEQQNVMRYQTKLPTKTLNHVMKGITGKRKETLPWNQWMLLSRYDDEQEDDDMNHDEASETIDFLSMSG